MGGAVEIRSGVCRYCGCTDERACPEGCWWLEETHTVCTNKGCIEKHFAAAKQVIRMLRELAQTGPEAAA
jgi:hypothetical protein